MWAQFPLVAPCFSLVAHDTSSCSVFPLVNIVVGTASSMQHMYLEVAKATGVIGFIRFLMGHYLILIIQHKTVGKIGHHYILSIEETMLLPLFVQVRFVSAFHCWAHLLGPNRTLSSVQSRIQYDIHVCNLIYIL